MKNTIKVFGIIALVAVIGFAMAACKNDPDYSPDPNNPVKGKWEGDGFKVYCTTNTWSAEYPSQGGSWSGTYTYTVTSIVSTSVSFTDKAGIWGTATVSGDTMTVNASTISGLRLTRQK